MTAPLNPVKPVGPRPRRCAEHTSHRAGCTPCRTWAAWYFRYRASLIRAGRWEDRVPVGKVAGYLSYLYEAGMSDAQVAERAGLNEGTVGFIRRGRRPFVTAETAAAVLGVELLPAAQRRGFIDAAGTRRRMQALGRGNWSQEAVSDAIARTETTVRGWVRLRATLMCSDAAALTAFYEANATRTGPGKLTAARARSAGWLPWYAWRDAEELDDPGADPHEKLPTTVVRRKLRALAAMAWAPENIAAEMPDLDVDRLYVLMRSQSSHLSVPRWAHNAVGHFFDRYGSVTGPAYALGAEARESGWPTATAWDGRDINDPADRGRAQPDPGQPAPAYSEAGIALALSGHTCRSDLNDLEAAFVVAVLRQRGLNDHEVALHLRWPGKDPHGGVTRLMCDDRRPVFPPALAARLDGWVDDREPAPSGRKGRRPGATNLASREGAAA